MKMRKDRRRRARNEVDSRLPLSKREGAKGAFLIQSSVPFGKSLTSPLGAEPTVQTSATPDVAFKPCETQYSSHNLHDVDWNNHAPEDASSNATRGCTSACLWSTFALAIHAMPEALKGSALVRSHPTQLPFSSHLHLRARPHSTCPTFLV